MHIIVFHELSHKSNALHRRTLASKNQIIKNQQLHCLQYQRWENINLTKSTSCLYMLDRISLSRTKDTHNNIFYQFWSRKRRLNYTLANERTRIKGLVQWDASVDQPFLTSIECSAQVVCEQFYTWTSCSDASMKGTLLLINHWMYVIAFSVANKVYTDKKGND